jgi:hypothetical protein
MQHFCPTKRTNSLDQNIHLHSAPAVSFRLPAQCRSRWWCQIWGYPSSHVSEQWNIRTPQVSFSELRFAAVCLPATEDSLGEPNCCQSGGCLFYSEWGHVSQLRRPNKVTRSGQKCARLSINAGLGVALENNAESSSRKNGWLHTLSST